MNHTPPKDFPAAHLTAILVPIDFARAIVEAAAKSDVLFEDQLLAWAQMGAECGRLHQSKK